MKGLSDPARSLRFLRRILVEVDASLVMGFVALGLVAAGTRQPWGVSTGFPLVWSTAVTGCASPNPFNGCGFAYSLQMIALDYALWTAAIFAVVAGTVGLRRRTRRAPAP